MADEVINSLIQADYSEQFKRLEEIKNKSEFDREYEKIREQIIEENIMLVDWCLKTYFSNVPLPYDEAKMYGIEGLVIAVNNYDYTKGFKFSAYAIRSIKHNIQRYFKEMLGVRWVNYDNEEISSIEQMVSESSVVVDDLSDPRFEMPMTLDDYQAIDDYEDENLVGYEQDFAEITDYHMLKKVVSSIIGELREEEQKVLKLRFGFDGDGIKTREEVAKDLGVSLEVERGIEARAIKHLRHPIRARKLRPFYESGEVKGNRDILVNINLQNQIFIYLVNLIKNQLSFSSMLEFINMNFNMKWTNDDLVKAIEILNKLAVMINEKVNKNENITDIIRELNESSLYPVVFNNRYYTWLSGFSEKLVASIINDYKVVDLEQMKKM